MQTSPQIIVIAGATASGKSALALELAKELDGVVINADSMQVYKDIPILSAAPTLEDCQTAPHKLYGIYEADVKGNVVDWLNLAKVEIDKARFEHKTPIVTGGTGLYIESLTKGVTPIPETPLEIRKEVDAFLKEKGLQALYEELQNIDSDTAERLSPNDTTRIKRAVEIYRHTHKTASFWHTVPLKTIYNSNEFLSIYVKTPRKILDKHARIRFDIMLELGALEEVKNMMKKNLPDSLPSQRALGLQELKKYLKKECSLEEAVELAKLHTRQYAKRQATWFNNRFSADICYHTDCDELKNIVDDIKKAHKYLAK